MSPPSKHRRIVLASRPDGMVSPDNFRLEEAPTPEPRPGEVLVRQIVMSLDPYMRGRMNAVASYAPNVQIGAVMTCGGVGEVAPLQGDARVQALLPPDALEVALGLVVAAVRHVQSGSARPGPGMIGPHLEGAVEALEGAVGVVERPGESGPVQQEVGGLGCGRARGVEVALGLEVVDALTQGRELLAVARPGLVGHRLAGHGSGLGGRGQLGAHRRLAGQPEHHGPGHGLLRPQGTAGAQAQTPPLPRGSGGVE